MSSEDQLSGPPRELVRFLISSGVGERSHSGRRLLDHLVGTYRLMRAWRCEEYLCRAGLFHSIYGTSSFTASCLPVSRRKSVGAIIGDAAEQLVYLFSVAERPNGLLNAGATLRIESRIDGTEIAVLPSQARDLVAIECANLAEQGDLRLLQALFRLSGTQRETLLDSSITSSVLTYLNDERRN